MVQCPGLSGLWIACPQTLSGLQPFEVQAFSVAGEVLVLAVFVTALLTLALVMFSLMRD